MDKTYTVFTYGTLMQGFYGHELLMNDAEFLCEASVNGELRCFTLDYPVMIKKKNCAKPVKGELYKVNEKTMEKLRKYEGIGNPFSCYEEKSVQVKTNSGVLEATSFVVPPRMEIPMKFTTRHIREADWRKFKETKIRFPLPQPLVISLAASLFAAVIYELHHYGFLNL